MKKFFGKIALPLLLAAALCIQPISAAPEEGNAEEAVADTATETKALAEDFQVVLENGNYTLAFNQEDGSVAVTDRKTGKIHYTNPLGANEDKLAEGGKGNLLKSQLTVQYYQDEDNAITQNSYADCIRNDGLSHSLEDGIFYVNYMLGDVSFDPNVIPLVLTKERMEKDILSKLSEDEREEVLDRYRLYERDELDKEVLDGLKLAYPSIEKYDIYVRENIPTFKAEAFYELFKKAGYTTEDLQKDYDQNELENPYEPKPYFDITLEYKLTDYGFNVTVDPEKIKYNEDYKPVRIDVLPYFDAADTTEKGFILVPDGSGSVIDFNNNKHTVNVYEKYLFENDYTSDITEYIATAQESVLPVFALSGKSGGYLATIDSGYEEVGIFAGVSGKTSSYNNVYPYFDLVSHSKISYAVQNASNILAMTDDFISCKLSVSYHLLDKAASYAELAVMYRGILKEQGLLPEESKTDIVDLNLELIGSVHVKKRFLGIPYETITSMTDYSQAAEILGELEGLTTEVNYINAFSGGLLQKTLNKFKPLSVLGSKKKRKALSELTERLTFSYNAQYAVKVKNGDAAKKLNRSNAKVYRYDTVGRSAVKSNALTILSPAKLGKYVKKATKSFDKYDIEAVNILDLGSHLNSDFKVGSQQDRYQARQMAEEYLSAVSEGKHISVKTGSVYAFNHVDKITEIPLTHTGYKIEDRAVPFYQIVISGIIPYTAGSVNCADEGKIQFLKAVETGAQLQYTWYYEKPDNISKTQEDYYGMSYASTIEEAKANAESYKPLYEKIAGKAIVDHSYVSETLTKTVWENGITVYVNFSDEEASVSGTTVKPRDFAVIGG